MASANSPFSPMMLPDGVIKQLTAKKPKAPKGRYGQALESAGRFVEALPGAVIETVRPAASLASKMAFAPDYAGRRIGEAGIEGVVRFLNSEDGMPAPEETPPAVVPEAVIPPAPVTENGWPEVTGGASRQDVSPAKPDSSVVGEPKRDPNARKTMDELKTEFGYKRGANTKDTDDAAAIAGLRARRNPLFDELPRSGVKHIIDGEGGAPDREYFEPGNVPTRAQSEAERGYEGMQLAAAERQQAVAERNQALPTTEVADLMRRKDIISAENDVIAQYLDQEQLAKGYPRGVEGLKMMIAHELTKELDAEFQQIAEDGIALNKSKVDIETDIQKAMARYLLRKGDMKGNLSVKAPGDNSPNIFGVTPQ